MTVIREDENGIFVIAGGYQARPGDVRGHANSWCRMDSAGLKKGDRVKARHIPGTPFTRIKLEDGTVLEWGHSK